MRPAWYRDTQGSLVWNAVVILAVLLPLASLSVDVPEYFRVASHLEQSLATAAQDAANTCLDLKSFSQSGVATLDLPCLRRVAGQRFDQATVSLADAQHAPSLTQVTCHDACQTVTLQGTTTVHVFFALSPAVTLVRTASSRVRMTSG